MMSGLQPMVEVLERRFRELEAHAQATLAHLGPSHGRDSVLQQRDADRRRAATLVLALIHRLRRMIEPPALAAVELVQAIDVALLVGTLADDAMLDRWIAHDLRVRQAARARRAAAAKRVRQTQARQGLRDDVARLRTQHPTWTPGQLARLLDPAHVNRMRQRILRLDLTPRPVIVRRHES